MINLPEDTIVAVSTSLSEGAIGLVRICGPESIRIADEVFYPKKKALKPSSFESHRMYFGRIIQEGETVDEGMACWMKSPESYTGEDIFEIYAHGSPYILKKIVSIMISKGARIAEPGEFTKRAFLNGKMDLVQAESVIDLIQSKSELQRKYALNQMEGVYSRDLSEIREKIFNTMVESEANIDFPEYVPEEVSHEKFTKIIQGSIEKIKRLLHDCKNQKVLKEGFKIVITGEPNAGKSSLLNTFAGKELAIVTELPGTTRDALEHVMDIKGIPVHFIDTAGIREPENIIEKKGIEIARKNLREADIVLRVIDYSKKLKDEKNIKNLIKDQEKSWIILNKIDLPEKIDMKSAKEMFKGRPIFKISATQGTGVADLFKNIEEWVLGHVDHLGVQYMINGRHQGILIKVLEYLESAKDIIDKRLGDDLISADLRHAVEKIDEILGRHIDDEIINSIFSRFCIGK